MVSSNPILKKVKSAETLLKCNQTPAIRSSLPVIGLNQDVSGDNQPN